MSYWCQICFKEIAGDDVYEFLQRFKSEAIVHIPEIAKNQATFSPLFRDHSWTEDFEPSRELRNATIEWAKSSLFRYRFFYDKEHSLLGVYSVDASMHGLFDCVHEFQNSCDQNYDFDTWHGVGYFEEVARKWQMASVDTLKAWHKEHYEEDLDPGDAAGLDYVRQSAAYREIWDNFEHTLEDDDNVVYLSLFGFYDFESMMRFYACVLDAVKRKIAEWNEVFQKKGHQHGQENG